MKAAIADFLKMLADWQYLASETWIQHADQERISDLPACSRGVTQSTKAIISARQPGI